MPPATGSDDRSRAWKHFERTGVILPGHQSEIAARLAARQRDESTENAAEPDERARVRL